MKSFVFILASFIYIQLGTVQPLAHAQESNQTLYGDFQEIESFSEYIRRLALADPADARLQMEDLKQSMLDATMEQQAAFWLLNFQIKNIPGYEAFGIDELIEFGRVVYEDADKRDEFFYEVGRVATAENLYETAISLFEAFYEVSQSERQKIRYIIAIGLNHSLSGSIAPSYEYFYNAVGRAIDLEDSHLIADASQRIAVEHIKGGARDRARIYLEDANKHAEIAQDTLLMAGNFNVYGVLNRREDNLDEAEYWYLKGVDLMEQIEPHVNLLNLYNNLHSLYLLKNDFDKAEYYLQKALELNQIFGDRYRETFTLVNLSRLEAARGNLMGGVRYMEQMYDLAKEIKSRHRATLAIGWISEYYAEMEMYKEAYEYFRLYKTYSDSVVTQSEQSRITIAENRHDMELRQREVELENSLNTARLENEILQRRTRNFALIVFLVIAAGIGFVYRKRSRDISVINKTLEANNLEISTQRDELIKARDALESSIQKQKIIQEQLLKEKKITDSQAEELRRLDAEKSKFFANISHEFRTPLTLISAPLENLKTGKHGALSAEGLNQVDMALRNSKRLLKLVEQLLDLARFESQQFELDLQKGDLVSFVKSVASRFPGVAERYGVTFKVDIPDTKLFVDYDADQMEKVVSNLLSNAFKFTDKGGEVQLSVAGKDDEAVIRVKDSGRGIHPDNLARIFDRFYQVEKSELQPGTGIGLSLAKEITQEHGGRIRVESELSKGSLFQVMLPLSKVQSSDVNLNLDSDSELIEEAKMEMPDANLGDESVIENEALYNPDAKKRVLIVDDNPDIRSYLKSELSDIYAVDEAQSGSQAIGKVKKMLPDLIISDIMMPDGDGYSLLREIRSNSDTDFIPVILLTARAEAEDKLEGLGIGADDYLTKPFSMEEVSLRVRNLMDRQLRLRKRLESENKDSVETKKVIHPDKVDAESTDDQYLDQVKQVIQENMSDEDFSVEDLAGKLFQSRIHLYRKLKTLTEESPSDLLRRMRLERASSLIEQKAGTISEVAYSVGFKSVAQFSTSFKQHFGQTPSEHQASIKR